MDNKIEQFLLFRIRAFADQKAFERLVNEYGPRIDKFLRTRLPRIEDAQDAYAEVWANLWTYAQNAKIDSVSGLIYKIAKNEIAKFYGNKSRKPEVYSTEEHDVTEIAVPLHEEIIAKVDVKILKEVMRDLDEDDEELILLRYTEGYRVKEIAKYFGKSENTTSVMLNRAVKKLRDLIRKKFGDL